jgi:heterodisulfide reductase subunit C
MSWLKCLKALFRAENDAIENKSEDVVGNEDNNKTLQKVSRQNSSDTKIAEEIKDSSVANISKTPTSNKSKESYVKKGSGNNEISSKNIDSQINRENSKKFNKKDVEFAIDDNKIVGSDSSSIKDSKSVKDTKKSINNVEDDNSKKIAVEENKKVSEEKKQKKGDNMTLLEENIKLTSDSIDKEFTQLFIDAGIDTVEHCFQCGTCSGGCPSGRRTPYKIRQLVRKCLMGLKDEVVSDPSLWMCTTCYTCQERCPRQIKIVEIIKLARNEAAKAGYMAPAHKATGSFVIKTGHAVPINDATKELRKRVGIGELPPTTHSDAKALKDIQTICKATGFNRLIGFNEETGELE